MQRRQYIQHRVLGHVLGIGVGGKHPANRSEYAIDMLSIKALAGDAVAATREIDEPLYRRVFKQLAIASQAAGQRLEVRRPRRFEQTRQFDRRRCR
jgi:hypothetical protein